MIEFFWSLEGTENTELKEILNKSEINYSLIPRVLESVMVSQLKALFTLQTCLAISVSISYSPLTIISVYSQIHTQAQISNFMQVLAVGTCMFR